MNENQRRAAVVTIAVLCLASVVVPYRYTYYNQLCRITTMCGGDGEGGQARHGTRYAPVWASPTEKEIEGVLYLAPGGGAGLPTVEAVELDTGRLMVQLLVVGIVGAFSIVALGRRTPTPRARQG